MNKEYNCVEVKLKNKDGEEFKALYDKSRQLLFMSDYTMGIATKCMGWEIVKGDNE